MNSVLTRRESMEKTDEERAIALLYAYCSQETAKEKRRMKNRPRAQNRNMRYPGH